MEASTTTTCPRCNYDDPTYKGTRTERWGHIIDIEGYHCPACSLDFEREV